MRWIGVVLFPAGAYCGSGQTLWLAIGSADCGFSVRHRFVMIGAYGMIRNPSYLGLLVRSLDGVRAFRSGVGLLLVAI